jgi:hypothetical protein
MDKPEEHILQFVQSLSNNVWHTSCFSFNMPIRHFKLNNWHTVAVVQRFMFGASYIGDNLAVGATHRAKNDAFNWLSRNRVASFTNTSVLIADYAELSPQEAGQKDLPRAAFIFQKCPKSLDRLTLRKLGHLMLRKNRTSPCHIGGDCGSEEIQNSETGDGAFASKHVQCNVTTLWWSLELFQGIAVTLQPLLNKPTNG